MNAQYEIFLSISLVLLFGVHENNDVKKTPMAHCITPNG